MCLAQWLDQNTCSLNVSQHYYYFKSKPPWEMGLIVSILRTRRARLRGVMVVQLCSQLLWQVSAHLQGQVRCPLSVLPGPHTFLSVLVAAWCEYLFKVIIPHCKCMRTSSGSKGLSSAVIPVSSRVHGESWLYICWLIGNLRPCDPGVLSWFHFFLIVRGCVCMCSFLGIMNKVGGWGHPLYVSRSLFFGIVTMANTAYFPSPSCPLFPLICKEPKIRPKISKERE